jgi:hypothetical protein
MLLLLVSEYESCRWCSGIFVVACQANSFIDNAEEIQVQTCGFTDGPFTREAIGLCFH